MISLADVGTVEQLETRGIPSGTYKVTIDSYKLPPSKGAVTFYIPKFVIREGDYSGRYFEDIINPYAEKGTYQYKRSLLTLAQLQFAAFGELFNFSSYEELLGKLVGKTVIVYVETTKRKNSHYLNTNIKIAWTDEATPRQKDGVPFDPVAPKIEELIALQKESANNDDTLAF
jgi:hypothetical protein